MTDAERERLDDYHRLLADRMGLRDWIVSVRPEPADEGFAGQLGHVVGRKVANVHYAADWAAWPAERFRLTVVHELIHCHFSLADDFLRRRLGKEDYRTYELLQEPGVDGIAQAWAPGLPLLLRGSCLR